MSQPGSRVGFIAKAVGAIAALALFVSSLTSLLALDGELEGAVSAERDATSVPVVLEVKKQQHGAECPWAHQGPARDRLRS
jgi:hypothetical protein